MDKSRYLLYNPRKATVAGIEASSFHDRVLPCFSHYQKTSIWGAERPPELILTLTSRWLLWPGSVLTLCGAWSLGNERTTLTLFREAADLQLNGNNLWPLPLRTRTAPVTHGICPLHPICNPSFPSVKSALSQRVQIQGTVTKTLILTDWKEKEDYSLSIMREAVHKEHAPENVIKCSSLDPECVSANVCRAL